MHRLSDDNGIVNDNTESQQKGEQADHIQSLPCVRQKEERSHVGDHNTDRHPKGQHGTQEQHQNDDDQHQAAKTIAHQSSNSLFKGLRGVLPEFQRYALG